MNPDTLTLDEINNNPGTFDVPTIADTAGETGLPAYLAAFTKQAQTSGQAEQTAATDVNQLLKDLMSESTERTTAEEAVGIPTTNKELSDLRALQVQQTAQYLGGLNTIGAKNISREGQAIGERSLNRQHGIDALLTSSLIQAKQGQLTFAQDTVDRAMKLKYDPLRAELEAKKQILSQVSGKAAKDRQNVLDLQLKQIELDQEAEKDIKNLAIKLGGFGVDSETVNKVLNATSYNEAISIAGDKIQDPRAKFELAKLKAETRKAQLEASYFEEYGGLSPSEYNAKIAEQLEQVKAETEAKQKARKATTLLDQSINQIDAILNSTALDSVVGSNPFSRSITRQKGKTMNALSAVSSLGLSGTFAEFSGKADDTVALTQQMLDQQFLDKLIDVKSQGATFGALSDNEGTALRNAANAIAGTAIKSGEKVIGYDMSEKTFKEQMQIIRDNMQTNRNEIANQRFSDDEVDMLDNTVGTGSTPTAINPAGYYQ